MSPLELPLHCLEGQPPPDGLAQDLSRIASLPDGARKELWRVLGPSLGTPLDANVERALDAYVARHALDPDELAAILKACRFLLRGAARIALRKNLFADDIDALTGQRAEVRELLVGGYDAAIAALRREMVGGTLGDHGKVVQSVRWKIERLVASDRASAIDMPIASLTFNYLEGGNAKDRVTLVFPPEVLGDLMDACRALVGERK